MPRNFIYIINPISGTKTKKDVQELIEKKTKEQNISFQIFPSVASGDYSFLYPIIEEQKVTDIIIAGGDGTVNQVINSLLAYDVNFGIIPCGSGNGLALTAKIPKQPAKALAVVFNGKPVATDAFYINNDFACMLCGLGFDAKVAHDFAHQSKRGLITYIKEVVKNFLTAKTYLFDIIINNKQFSTDAFFISIANSNQFGNNFKIAPKASLSDGLLDIVIVPKQNKLSLVVQTLKQITGNNKLQTKTIEEKNKGIIYFQTKKITILNKSEAPLHIDGDPAETSASLEIIVKAKCFRLYQPV
ncbi:MAG: YegS/Rv2252/BmrU family lipid kinase [Chitinophagaceae bacterium]